MRHPNGTKVAGSFADRPAAIEVEMACSTTSNTRSGPVRKAPSRLFTIWVSHSTAIYFFSNYFKANPFGFGYI